MWLPFERGQFGLRVSKTFQVQLLKTDTFLLQSNVFIPKRRRSLCSKFCREESSRKVCSIPCCFQIQNQEISQSSKGTFNPFTKERERIQQKERLACSLTKLIQFVGQRLKMFNQDRKIALTGSLKVRASSHGKFAVGPCPKDSFRELDGAR